MSDSLLGSLDTLDSALNVDKREHEKGYEKKISEGLGTDKLDKPIALV